ncbi:MAG: molecular chaperone DnaJ [Bradyrhizobium sp.]|nr:MAG: molecular chaperone DnaJ [Bradyrhizobium sp.]
MPSLIAGIIAVYLAWVATRRFTQLSPVAAANLLRRLGAAAAVVVALVLLLRGNIGGAITLGAFAFSLGLWGGRGTLASAFNALGGGARARRPASAHSASIEMRLDPTTGVMSGRVLAGPLQGRDLDTLTRADCLALRQDCLREDPEGARLLETYLDRRFAGWRQTDEGQGEPGRGRNAGGQTMTRDEAYEVLGLPQGAGAEEIIRAHRSLMKKLHPDHGGSTALAARVNQAKDILLRHG